MGQTPEQNLERLGITLPEASQPIATYVNLVRVGDLLFMSGKGPLKSDGTHVTGKVGKDLSVEQGYEAARLAAVCHIAVLKNELGNLNRVKRIVKVFGMVNCADDFLDQPRVMNGYSDLMVSVFWRERQARQKRRGDQCSADEHRRRGGSHCADY